MGGGNNKNGIQRYCLIFLRYCAQRWAQAYNAGTAPKLYLRATHEKTLDYIPLEILRMFALDADEADAVLNKLTLQSHPTHHHPPWFPLSSKDDNEEAKYCVGDGNAGVFMKGSCKLGWNIDFSAHGCRGHENWNKRVILHRVILPATISLRTKHDVL